MNANNQINPWQSRNPYNDEAYRELPPPNALWVDWEKRKYGFDYQSFVEWQLLNRPNDYWRMELWKIKQKETSQPSKPAQIISVDAELF